MKPIDTGALSVAAQMRLADLPAALDRAPKGADLAAGLFAGDRVDLSPGAQGLISGESANENSVSDAARAIGLADWPGTP